MSTEIIGKIKSPEGWKTEDPSVWGGGVADLSSLYKLNQQHLSQVGNPVDVSQDNGTCTNILDGQTVQTR